MRHLRDLARSGLNTLHLLPTNDIATIEEDRSAAADSRRATCRRSRRTRPSSRRASRRSPAQDGFNWGYDPLHYTTPGGLLRDRPGRRRRARCEFRQMVQGINGAGLRVVMDVVYNHTPAAGQDPKSVLDRIVPGYYHRLDPDHRRGRDVHLLLEHRDRARDDGASSWSTRW